MYNDPYSRCMQHDSEQRYLTPIHRSPLVLLQSPPYKHTILLPLPLTLAIATAPAIFIATPLQRAPSPNPTTGPRPQPRHQRLPRPLLRLHLPLLLHKLLLLHHAHREGHAQHDGAGRQHPEALAAPPGAGFGGRKGGRERRADGAPVAGGEHVAEGQESVLGEGGQG